ncbi:hypothetical protein [Agrobacterium sp. CG674]
MNDRQAAIVKALLGQQIAQANLGGATLTTVADEVSLLDNIRNASTDDDPHRNYLKGKADDEMEVDDDAVVSPGSDAGAFVHAWIWVTNEQAGIFVCDECDGEFTLDRRGSPECDVCDECFAKEDDEDGCSECGESLDDAGDGWDGMCPSCADNAAAKDTYPENWTKDDG